MSKRVRSTVAMILMLVLVIGLIPPIPVSAAADTSPMGEIVDSYTANSSTFTLTDTGRVFVVADTEPTGELLQTVQLIHRQFVADGYDIQLAWGPESWIADGDIVIRLDASSGIAAEGYELDVTTTAQVTASDVDGLIYGANMILKHLRYAGSNSIQGFTAADAPDTVGQRAVSLDCGRKYYTKDWICNFIREMSWMGYNTLEFHFSDDSGFRFDLWDEAYYTGDFQPANDFSWICGSNYTSWTLSAYQNDADKGKYLSAAEVLEILETAAEYHIEVIPCFDSPSHLDYLTWTFEQHYDSDNSYSFYSTYDQKTYYAADVNGVINYTNSRDWSTDLKWPYYSAVDVTGDLAKAFIFELYIDIANFFKEYAGSTEMSVGADEVQLSTANLASGYSYAWGFSDFVDYINELNTLMNDMGYTMRMFNDFIGSTAYNASSYDFADNIEIMYWDSPLNPSSSTASNHTEPVSYFVDKGMILYNCIQTGTYYALRKTSSGSDARSVDNRQWTFYHANEEDIWNEWYSADISEHGDYSEDVEDVPAANLGGAYFLIWCDYACISTEKEIWNGCYDTSGSGEYYSLRDRMWSNITKQWNWDVNDTLTFSDFTTIRDAYGDHPGLGTTTSSCSEATLLPGAVQPVSGYAGGCDTYVAYGQIAVTNTTSVMSLPCTSAVESSSAALEVGNVGDVYTTIQLLENTVGELWYKVETKTGLVGFIRATDTTYVKDLTDDIIVTGASYPSGHVQGNWFLVQGEISSTYNTLTSVAVYIHSGFGVDGEIVTGSSDTVTDNYYSLIYSNIDNNTVFNSVPLGNHTYAISADYTSYHANGDTVVTGTGKAYVLEKCFVVLSATVDQSSCSHSYSETVYKDATCIEAGLKVYACSKCGYVYEEAIAMSGHSYTEEIIGATCLDYEKVRYTCSLCSHSYEEYSESAKTAWSTTKPEGVDESLIETKTQYRYSDYETTTSYETSLDGWTQIGNSWVQSGTGSVLYVNSWPSGFLTTDSLYTQYNNKASKVEAVTTDTTQRVINSDKITGYLYYHWCWSGSYFSYSTKGGNSKCTTFHAFYYNNATLKYTDYDSSDGSYENANSSCCTNSDWWWYVPVYTQSYTDYQKQFTYERWTDYTAWSDNAATASTTRKVETQTLYRYVSGQLGEHVFDANSICTVCGAACDHTFQNNVCTACGYEKPVLDYYLFGYINGANYACEEDSANLGEYKFVDGQLVVFFTEDSYVGIKGSDNATYYMTDGWQGFVSSVTLYNTAKLTTADKLFVPGGTEVTFTLVDNGDDTYQLSYVAVECGHASHSTDGICTVCGDAVEHSYGTDGYCACGLECVHQMVDGVCELCGKYCDHVYQNFACTICGEAKPTYEFYLFGYINGANYACEEDFANLGEYKFVDGQVIVRFTSDSYVAVKAADNEHWYMTAGWQGQVNSAVLYNTTTLSNADKLYVPGGKEVTFTLVDNGDDTYTLSYEATCAHISHDTAGICAACGETVMHTLQNNVCTVCGYEKPAYDYYLFGWINGADYADKDDQANLGEYKFVDGQLVAFFTVDSYVGVKSSDNLNWYMTQGYLGQVTSATLYNAEAIVGEDKLFVPAGKIITFTLVDNGDDTYVLSYVATDCPHESHDETGICTLCGAEVEHTYVNGACECGKACVHVYSDGVCSICGMACAHTWRSGYCDTCGMICSHSWENGACTVCSMTCEHSWQDGVCTNCALVCTHIWENGRCSVCAMMCSHTYQDNVCTNCAMEKPVVDYYLCGTINGADYAYGTDAANDGDYKFVDGKLVITFRQDSYVGLKASDGKNWYLTDGDQGQVTSVILYNGQTLSDAQLLYVPGCMEITFTLVDNGDDTLTLSYEATPCAHSSHDTDGNCTACGTAVGHSYESVVTAPTCTEAGYTTHTCACGSTYTDSETAALGHSYESVTNDATCTADGSIVYTCACGDTYTETISALGHSYEAVVTAPTCTEAGYTTHTCAACGDSYVDSETAALGHSYETIVTAPTCTEAGYTTYTCACGDTYTADEVAATGHSYESVTTDATCTADGSIVYTCACGDTYTETIPALGHSYESVVTAPTCTEAGYTTHTCTACGDSYTDSETVALGHDWKNVTCTAPKTCATCGETEGEALGHDWQDATCTAPKTCATCGETEGEALGHSWNVATCTAGKTCTVCGETTGNALGHTYESVVTAPTCTAGGYTTHTCTVCGDTYTDSETVALGHSYETVVTAPTCTEAGYTTYTCACGDTYTADEVAATGHSYESVETVPTCTVDGSIVYTCACGDTYTETIPALGHSYESVVTAPTCTEAGYTTYTCGCGDTYTADEVAATGHSYVDGVCETCGEQEPITVVIPSTQVTGVTLAFEEEILYNIYFTVDDLSSVVEMGLVTFHEKLTDGTHENAVDVIPGYEVVGSEIRVHTNGIPAKNMGDALYFRVYALLTDGTYAYGDVLGYHAVAYANSILANSDSAEMKALVVALLNYGAEAQLYFGYNTDSLMNAGLTDEHQALVTPYDESLIEAVVPADETKTVNFPGADGFSNMESAINFEGAFSINYYFTPAYAVEGDMILYWWDAETYGSVDVLTKENATGSMVMTSGAEYWGAVAEIAAKEIDQTVYVSGVYSSGGVEYTTGVLAYSLGHYCKTKAADSTSEMQSFAAATAVYGYSAKQYFASIA